MRTRTAKALAQRIDMNYFKRPHPLRRWRMLLSIAAPVAGLLWLAGAAGAGSRAPYSSGPLSTSHAFIETKCEVCHVPAESFRMHVGDLACLTCHDAPPHPPSPTPASLASASAGQATAAADAPDCAACHREHRGRVQLAVTRDQFCIDCHSGTNRAADERSPVTGFPDGHPPFTTSAAGATDPGTVRFNHEVHIKADLRGPNGPETLECVMCHQPELARSLSSALPRPSGRLMQPISYEQQCARCHVLYFDEFIDAPAPHEKPEVVRAFVEQALREHIAANPGDLRRERPIRRLPLNFPRPPEPPARTPQEWVTRRAARAEVLLWSKTCAECHTVDAVTARALPTIAPANLRSEWMPRAAFSHTPHLMVRCEACHAATESRLTSDVLMPSVTTCATCHTENTGTMAQCAECHRYHDWSKAQPVNPHFTLDAFR